MNFSCNHNREKLISILIFIGHQIMVIPTIYLNINSYMEDGNNSGIDVQRILFLLVHLFSLNFSWLSIYLLAALSNRLNAINSRMNDQGFYYSKIITILYDKSCETTDLINKCFSYGFLMIFLQFMLQCVFISFGLCHIILNNSTPMDRKFIVDGCLYIIPHFTLALFIIFYSNFIKHEGNRTLIIIHTLGLKNNQKDLKFCQLASLQLEHRAPEISCGLFKIDMTYFFVFIASIFSYTLILIQFEVNDTYKSLESAFKS